VGVGISQGETAIRGEGDSGPFLLREDPTALAALFSKDVPLAEDSPAVNVRPGFAFYETRIVE